MRKTTTKKMQDKATLLVEKLISISEPNTLGNDGGELRARFYFGDLETLIEKIISGIIKRMNEEKLDAELRAIPEGKYKDGYLVGYSDAIETLEDSSEEWLK